MEVYNLVFFGLVPVILIGVFIGTNLSPNLLPYFGNSANLVGFITALMTYLYVILTGQMVRQMIKSSEQELRPYIIVDIEIIELAGYFILRNIGKMPAQNLRVTINPELIALDDKSLSTTLLKNPIAFMPPGKEIRTVLRDRKRMLCDEAPLVFEVELKYEWEGKSACEKYTVDISFYGSQYYLERKDIHDVAKSIEQINRNLTQIAKK